MQVGLIVGHAKGWSHRVAQKSPPPQSRPSARNCLGTGTNERVASGRGQKLIRVGPHMENLIEKQQQQQQQRILH